jgi:hypothetical protein
MMTTTTNTTTITTTTTNTSKSTAAGAVAAAAQHRTAAMATVAAAARLDSVLFFVVCLWSVCVGKRDTKVCRHSKNHVAKIPVGQKLATFCLVADMSPTIPAKISVI